MEAPGDVGRRRSSAVDLEDLARDEIDLASRASRGDHDAYAALVERHREVAFRVAYLVTGVAADAEDAAQEGFVKAYTQIHRFKPGSPFRPWLLKIVGNEARNRRRAEGRRSMHELRAGDRADPVSSVPRPDDEAQRSDTDARLLAAVNRLPDKERLVVGLRYFLELSEAETAAVAGLPRGTVKSRVSRALGRLRADLEDLDV